jgi:hypothetical protein
MSAMHLFCGLVTDTPVLYREDTFFRDTGGEKGFNVLSMFAIDGLLRLLSSFVRRTLRLFYTLFGVPSLDVKREYAERDIYASAED